MWRQDNVIVVTGTLEVEVDTSSPSSVRVLDAVTLKRTLEPAFELELSTTIDATRHLLAEEQHTTLSFPFAATGTPLYTALNALSCPEEMFLDLVFQLEIGSSAQELWQQSLVVPVTCAACPALQGNPPELDRMNLEVAWSTPLFGASFSVDRVAVAADGSIWLSAPSGSGVSVTRVLEGRTSSTVVLGNASNLVLGGDLGYVATAGTDINRVVAVTPDGEALWTIRLPYSYRSPPLAFVDGRLFVAHFGATQGLVEEVSLAEREHYLLVFDAQTGALESALPWSPIDSLAPNVDGSLLIGNGDGITAVGSDFSVRQVAALNAAGVLAVDEGTGDIYVTGEDATVTKLNADGFGQWQRSGLPRAPIALAPLTDGTVLVGLESGALRLGDEGAYVGEGTTSLVEGLPFCPVEERIHVASAGGRTVYSSQQIDFEHSPKLSVGLLAPIDP